MKKPIREIDIMSVVVMTNKMFFDVDVFRFPYVTGEVDHHGYRHVTRASLLRAQRAQLALMERGR